MGEALLSKKEVVELFEIFEKSAIEPVIELNYTSPFTLLVAVVLSAQSTDKMVNKITPALFEVAKTPAEIAQLGIENLKKYIKSINYFNNKAKFIVEISKILIEQYDSMVPNDFDSLIALPGIGRKSANVILNTVYKQPTIAVDTHVFRVSNRLGLCSTKNPEATEFALSKVVPDRHKINAHHHLVLHGRYVCKARKPLCDACITQKLCKYYNNVKEK